MRYNIKRNGITEEEFDNPEAAYRYLESQEKTDSLDVFWQTEQGDTARISAAKDFKKDVKFKLHKSL